MTRNDDVRNLFSGSQSATELRDAISQAATGSMAVTEQVRYPNVARRRTTLANTIMQMTVQVRLGHQGQLSLARAGQRYLDGTEHCPCLSRAMDMFIRQYMNRDMNRAIRGLPMAQ